MPILGIDASRAVKKEKTGVEWYSYFLLRAMERCTPEGWRVRCYVPEAVESLKIKVDSWQWRELRWIGRGWTQGRLSLEMMKSPPDVLFVPSHTIPIVHPERTVTTVHDVVFLSHPELYGPEDLEEQRRGLDFALKFAEKIIVPSRAVREDLLRAGAGAWQVVMIPHGVEVDHNPSQPPLILRGGELGRYILFIGRLERKKNVLGLIHAFRRLVDDRTPTPPNLPSGRGGNETVSPPLGGGVRGGADLKLVLAGPTGYGGQDVLQAIKTFKLEDRVVHLGYVARAEYTQLLRHASLLILPSLGEGFGLPILEAMAAGTPVVCSDIPVLHEVGGNAVQYVDPRDPADIARGIQTVLQNEMLRSEMVRRGKELASAYGWEKAARETWEVIESLGY